MQDRAIIEIGKLKGGTNIKPYQNFIENMFPGKNYDIILAVFEFTKTGNHYKCEVRPVDIDKGSDKNYMKYAYRKGSARGGDITFTTKFGDIEKKFKNFYPKQVKDIIAFAKENEETEELAIFKALQKCLDESADQVKANLKDIYDSLDKVDQLTSGFSVRFEGLLMHEYPEDFSTIQKLLFKIGTQGKSEKYKVFSEGYDSTCSICLETKPILHGFASPFKYATVDKTGLVSGFFNQKNNWKNYPICSDCALDFEIGKSYITQHLTKYFYGKRYYIIPKITVGSNPKLLKRALNHLEDLDYQEKDGSQITARENFLMKKIGQEEGELNRFSLNLLFHEENPTTKAIKIKLLLEEIFPSRFQELFVTVPKIVNAASLYKEAMSVNKEKKDLQFDFAILRTFFGDDFYQIIQKVFLGIPLSNEALFDKLMQKIKRVYVDQGFDNVAKYPNSYFTLYINSNIKWHTSLLKLALMTIAYLKELNIIPKHKTSISMETKNEEISTEQEKKPAFDIEKFNSFIETNKDFFDLSNGHKAGTFAVGVLVRQVFNLQSANLEGNTPFEKKLRGYDLNPDLLKNIYIEALEKISRYTNIYSYQNLRYFINEHFTLNSHKLGQMSNNELSFYFVAGLEFGNQFKTKKAK